MKNPANSPLGYLIRCGYAVWRGVMRLIYRPKIVFSGEEARKALRRPCILIANHTSHLDGTFLPQSLARYRVHTFVARDWYDRPRLRVLFRHLPFLPMDRNGFDTEWLPLGEVTLENGYPILFFPEGKTSHTGELNSFHPGFALLARRAGVPVIPVALPGNYRKFRRNRIFIGEPMMPDTGVRGRLSLLCREDASRAEEEIATMLAAAR